MPVIGSQRFAKNLRRLARVTVPRKFLQIHRLLGLQAGNDYVNLTPVDFGQARNGWTASARARRPGPKEPPPDPTGRAARSRIRAAVGSLREFSVLYITNAVRHTAVLDQGLFIPQNPGPSKDPRPGRFGRVLVASGFSVQAPRGMTPLVVANLRRNLTRIVRRARVSARS